MNVLIGCERFGVLREAFRARGHNAWSCDLVPAADGSPNHFQRDVREVMKRRWDLAIFHPDCTYLCNSGVHWLSRRPDRWPLMDEAARFFKELLEVPHIPRVVIENPVMHKYAVAIIGRRQDQTIQPYEFGEPFSKRTGLWLRNVPPLQKTNVLRKEDQPGGHWLNQTPSGQNKLGPSEERAMLRAKTYQGIAEAMADQWGKL